MKYYIYSHTRLDTNEVFYIGVGTKYKSDYKSRVYRRSTDRRSRNQFWKNIVNKTKFKVSILFESDDKIEVKNEEIRLISFYGRRDLGKGTLVNLSNGGDGNPGYCLSEEHKRKLSEIGKKRKQSKETREKISKILTGRKRTKIQISLMRIRSLGNKNALGRKHTEEELIRMGNSHKKPILQFDLSNNLIKEWNSAKEASLGIGMKSSSSVSSAANGKGKYKNHICKNYKWIYK